MRIDQTAEKIVMNVTGPDGNPVGVTLDSKLFGRVQISLTASALGQFGTTHVELSNWVLTLPHEKFWASKVDDPRVTGTLVALALVGIALVVVVAVEALRRQAPFSPFPRFRFVELAPLELGAAVALYLIGNALFFSLGNQPFDMGGEKLFAYVGKTYGMAQLYYLPNAVSLAGIWHGAPFVEAAFPYEPVSAYLHNAIG